MAKTVVFDEPKAETTTPPIETGAPPPKPEEMQGTRKKRGRGPGIRNAAPPLQETTVGVEPGDAPQGDPQTRRKRKPSIDIEGLAKQLKGIHALGANLLPIRMPDGKLLLELSDTEATQLANAISGVAKEYDLALDGKTGAAIQLFAAAAMIYGPRVYVIQKMRMAQRVQTPVQDPSVVSEQNAGINGHATAN
jgi:hypothetical protein